MRTATQFLLSSLLVATAACSADSTDTNTDDGAIAGVPGGPGMNPVTPMSPATGGPMDPTNPTGTVPGEPVAPGGGGAPGTMNGTAGSDGAGGASVGTPADCSATLPGVQGHPKCDFDYPKYPGFTLALVEEFEAPIDLVTDPVWTYSDGALDEGGIRFVKDGVSFEDGVMKITVRPGDTFAEFSHAEQKEVSAKSLTSGEFRTKYNNYRYGRYEVSLKTPVVAPGNTQTNGGYVSTLFVFRTPKFQFWREIDIEATGDSPNALTTNIIHGENRQGWAPDFAAATSSQLAFNHREDFHTYAFEWTPDYVRWFVDGAQVREFTGKAGEVQVPTESVKIMMNLWLGGFGGDPTNNVYPLHSEYDWFRFYKWDMETTYPMDPATLPMTDLDGAKNNPEDGVPDMPPECQPGACVGVQ